MELYFSGKRRLGKGVIRQTGGLRRGAIDYRAEGRERMHVLDGDGYVLYRAGRETTADRWTVRDSREQVIGMLRREPEASRAVFEYEAGARGTYRIEETDGGYAIEGAGQSAFVDRKKNRLIGDEYWLQTDDGSAGNVDEYEWVAVMLGVEGLRGRTGSTT